MVVAAGVCDSVISPWDFLSDSVGLQRRVRTPESATTLQEKLANVGVSVLATTAIIIVVVTEHVTFTACSTLVSAWLDDV
jgi:hypothetical protein